MQIFNSANQRKNKDDDFTVIMNVITESADWISNSEDMAYADAEPIYTN